MSPPRLDWLARMMTHRPLTVKLSNADERRLRAYGDRLNRNLQKSGDPDLLDFDSDEDLAEVLLNAGEKGIEPTRKRARSIRLDLRGHLLTRGPLTNADAAASTTPRPPTRISHDH